METDYCYLDIPDFRPVYDKSTEYGYSGKARTNLEKLLRNQSKNHCMYCYALLRSDRVDTGELEHAIEKSLSTYLINCVPNLGLACNHCNTSLKRVGEKKRKENVKAFIEVFEKGMECKSTKCKEECEKYKYLKMHYCDKGKIILQPAGVKGISSGYDYCIQYDVFRAEFIPSTKYKYDEIDKAYINYHINHFRLNDKDYKTKALAQFVEETINADGKYIKSENHYSNYIVDLFIQKLEGLSQNEVLKICEKIYINYQMMFMY